MNKEEAIRKLQQFIEMKNKLPNYKPSENNTEFKKWHKDIEIALKHIFKNDSNQHVNDFLKITFNMKVFRSPASDDRKMSRYNTGIEGVISLLQSYIKEIQEFWNSNNENETTSSIDGLRLLLNNFHKIARQLRIRRDQRNTIIIDDEYDVQDLVHALLKIFFKDIRKEEYTPTYAGSASRIDFLLEDSKIALEIKKTRKTLTDKKLGEEILIDIQRYQSHPSVERLICFIYDPESLIINPDGLIKDLENSGIGINTEIIISPMF